MTLEDACRVQAQTCARLGSPFTAAVLEAIAEVWDRASPLAEHLSRHEGDIGPAGHSLPLRLAGGLHALVLSKRDAGLAAQYPPNPASADFTQIVARVLRDQEDFLIAWTESAPQTNEVRRSAALIPMAHVAAQRFDLPIHLSELGASGGLNLYWDRFALDTGVVRAGPGDPVVTLTPDWHGDAPPEARPVIASRGGIDLNPLDPRDPEDLLRLSSYLWPDQPERLARTRAVATIADTAVDKGDAIDWLERRLTSAPAGHLHLIQNTVAWQYFPQAAQARGQHLIESAGQVATDDRPLAWMQMETDGDTKGSVGAALTLQLWPGGDVIDCGRADFHGRWIKWAGPVRTDP